RMSVKEITTAQAPLNSYSLTFLDQRAHLPACAACSDPQSPCIVRAARIEVLRFLAACRYMQPADPRSQVVVDGHDLHLVRIVVGNQTQLGAIRVRDAL